MGPDELGRDIVSRLLLTIKIYVFVAIFGTVIGTAIGRCVSFLSAHARGRVEETVMMIVDLQAAVAFLIITLAVSAFFGNSLTLCYHHGDQRLRGLLLPYSAKC